jgi:hypothetical protein
MDADGRSFGLVRSYADPTLLYAVRMNDGAPGEPAAIGGHQWFREVEGVVQPVPAPPLDPEVTPPSRLRRVLRRLGLGS